MNFEVDLLLKALHATHGPSPKVAPPAPIEEQEIDLAVAIRMVVYLHQRGVYLAPMRPPLDD